MPEKVVPGPVCEEHSIREAVCIHTKKIFDSCREEDISLYILNQNTVFLTESGHFAYIQRKWPVLFLRPELRFLFVFD